MDPISAATTAIQVAAVGIEACVKLVKLLQEFAHASESIKSLVDRFTGLKILLKAFQEAWACCKSVTLDQYVKDLFQRSESSLRRLEKACKTFRREKEQGKSQQTVQKIAQSVKYVSKKNVIEELIRDASDFSADVGSIMQLCFFHKLHGDMMNKLDNIERTVSAIHSASEQDILKWLLKCSAVDSSDYKITHRDIRKQRTASTCEWLFKVPEWKQLLHTENSILWVYGIAGSGKSVLCSSIIDEVSKIAAQELGIAYAYYYFSRAGVPQTLDSCLMSLIHQLCAQHHIIPDSLRNAHASGHPPETEDLKCIMNELMGSSRRTILILDALDECTEIDNRDDVIDWLQHIHCHQSSSEFNIVITSRDQRDIRDVLSDMKSIEINLDHSRNHNDIRNYVERALLDHHRLKKIIRTDPSLGNKIIERLVGDANGMFLLASSRVSMLRNIRAISPRSIRQTLEELPKDVNGVYDQILLSIPQDTRDEAVRALCWLAMARRPLTIEELAEASVVEVDVKPGSVIDPDKKFIAPEEILELIPDFVTVREIEANHHVVQLAHATVYEYLHSDHIREFQTDFRIHELATHVFLTRCCLKYIYYRHNDFSILFSSGASSFPLIDYACSNWYKHFKLIPETEQTGKEYPNVENQVLEFLGSDDVFSTWRTLHKNDDEYNLEVENRSQEHNVPYRTGSPLYYASYLGLPRSCIETVVAKFTLDAPSGYWGTPMHAAVANESTEVAMFLLRLGADPNIPNRFYSNILIAAISNLLPEMALHLIHCHLVDVHTGSPRALEKAIAADLNDVAKALVEVGVPIDAISQARPSSLATTPLITAALINNTEMVEFLYHQGAALDQQIFEDPQNWKPRSYMTALQAASVDESYCLDTLQLLIRLGADVNVTKGYPCSPVCCAARAGSTRALHALLEAGADIHTYYSEEANPLWIALHSGQHKVALMLLEVEARMPGLDKDEMFAAIANACGPSTWVDEQIRELQSDQQVAKEQVTPVQKPLEAEGSNGKYSQAAPPVTKSFEADASNSTSPHAAPPVRAPKRPPRSDTLLSLPDIPHEETYPAWI